MPVTIEGARAVLDGHCTVEEALGFAEFLRDTPGAVVDVSGCLSIHTALYQCILALDPALDGLPGDPALARLLAAVPQAGGSPA